MKIINLKILCDYVDSIKQWLDDNDNKMKYIGDINKIYDDIINILYERKYEGKNDREEFYEYFTLKYSRDIFNLHSSLILIISHYIDDSLIDDDYTMIFDYLFDNLDMDDDFIKDDENDEIIDDYLSDYSTPFYRIVNKDNPEDIYHHNYLQNYHHIYTIYYLIYFCKLNNNALY